MVDGKLSHFEEESTFADLIKAVHFQKVRVIGKNRVLAEVVPKRVQRGIFKGSPHIVEGSLFADIMLKNFWNMRGFATFGVLETMLVTNAEQAILSKLQATLRSDLPFYMVPFTTRDLLFKKPEDNGEKFTSLLTAIGAYAERFSADPIIRRREARRRDIVAIKLVTVVGYRLLILRYVLCTPLVVTRKIFVVPIVDYSRDLDLAFGSWVFTFLGAKMMEVKKMKKMKED
uniref:Uncharacterized protein n=1 Tax=Cucumis melo TaxID=3656 RepID=A0A9I9EGL1_CUCME